MEAFRKYDKDQSGTIDQQELRALLRQLLGQRASDGASRPSLSATRIFRSSSSQSPPPAIIDRFVSSNLQLGDRNVNGTIDKLEFLRLYSKLFLESKGMPGVGPGAKK